MLELLLTSSARLSLNRGAVLEAHSQKLLLLMIEEPMSLYSSLVNHMSLHVDSEHKMDPPTQAPYLAYGEVATWRGWRRQREARVKEGRGEGQGKEGKKSTSKYNSQWWAQMPTP